MKKDILYINSVEDIRLVDTLHIQEKHDYSKDYLTFKALEDGAFTCTICYGEDSEGGGNVYANAKLQYSFNGEDWFDWTRQHKTSESITVLANQKLYVRGYTQPLDSAITDNVYGTIKFSSTCRFNVCGLLSSLLYGYDWTNQEFIWTKQPMKTTHFSQLFANCDKLISAENLILPQELVSHCYRNMFNGCTSLTAAPTLSATTLANSCYQSMFAGCTALTTTPELPATTLAQNCYDSMFSGCTSLISTSGLPATTLAKTCYTSMFKNCTSLTIAPELHATELTFGCYSGMFRGCTSLAIAPELPATTLTSSCYGNMFNGCTNLNYVKAMFTTTPSSSYTSTWLSGVSSTGTFVKNNMATWNVAGVDGIPTGWTVETVAPYYPEP